MNGSGGVENEALSKLGELLGVPPRPAEDARSTERGADAPRRPDQRPDARVGAQPDASPVAGVPVVRRERKQRGGKTVTRVARLELGAEELKLLARAMAKGLGCGAKVEGEDIIVQGDQVERAARWLERRGARRVVRGN
jgi:translation initiation factor 1